jgi:hypothetical protein
VVSYLPVTIEPYGLSLLQYTVVVASEVAIGKWVGYTSTTCTLSPKNICE